jgi:hypothetical protein
MEFVALFFRWLLQGGWKWLLGGAAALVIGWKVMAFVNHYHVIEAKAAQTDALVKANADLTAKAKAFDLRLAAVRDKQAQAEKDRDQARAALGQGDKDRAAYMAMLKGALENAAVRTNPLCWPSDGDRRLRNDFWGKFLGGISNPRPDGGAGGLPAVAP